MENKPAFTVYCADPPNLAWISVGGAEGVFFTRYTRGWECSTTLRPLDGHAVFHGPRHVFTQVRPFVWQSEDIVLFRQFCDNGDSCVSVDTTPGESESRNGPNDFDLLLWAIRLRYFAINAHQELHRDL